MSGGHRGHFIFSALHNTGRDGAVIAGVAAAEVGIAKLAETVVGGTGVEIVGVAKIAENVVGGIGVVLMTAGADDGAGVVGAGGKRWLDSCC